MSLKEVGAFVALLAALFAVPVLLTGTRKPQAREPARVDWDAVADEPGRKLKMTWMGAPTFPYGEEGGWIETMLEERFHVDLKPIFLDGHAYQKKKPLMFAGGDVPDLFIEYAGDVHRDAYHGFLLEVPYGLLKTYAPTYVKRINEVDPTGWLPASFEGRNYGLPINYVDGLYPAPGIWRMDWLRNVGIHKVPETLDEMHAALRKLRYGDPDGNGQLDTYGMSGDVSHWWWTSFAEVFAAFGVLPYDWMERDGRIVYGGLLPETKQALALLRQWHAEGLIDPDFANDTGDPWTGTVHAKFVSGRLGYLYYAGRFDSLDLGRPGSTASTTKTLNPKQRVEVVAGRFPKGPGGHFGGRVQGAGANAVAFGRHLAHEPEKVIRVLRMFEAMARDASLAIAAIAGQRGVHWDYADPAVGPGSGLAALPPYDKPSVSKRAVLARSLGAGSFFHPDSLSPETVDKYTAREKLAFRRTYRRREWARRNALGRTEYVPSARDYWRDLRMMQQQAFTSIIRGELPLGHFETFVARWKAQGGDILLEEANELKRLRDRIYREVGVK